MLIYENDCTFQRGKSQIFGVVSPMNAHKHARTRTQTSTHLQKETVEDDCCVQPLLKHVHGSVSLGVTDTWWMWVVFCWYTPSSCLRPVNEQGHIEADREFPGSMQRDLQIRTFAVRTYLRIYMRVCGVRSGAPEHFGGQFQTSLNPRLLSGACAIWNQSWPDEALDTRRSPRGEVALDTRYSKLSVHSRVLSQCIWTVDFTNTKFNESWEKRSHVYVVRAMLKQVYIELKTVRDWWAKAVRGRELKFCPPQPLNIKTNRLHPTPKFVVCSSLLIFEVWVEWFCVLCRLRPLSLSVKPGLGKHRTPVVSVVYFALCCKIFFQFLPANSTSLYSLCGQRKRSQLYAEPQEIRHLCNSSGWSRCFHLYLRFSVRSCFYFQTDVLYTSDVLLSSGTSHSCSTLRFVSLRDNTTIYATNSSNIQTEDRAPRYKNHIESTWSKR